MNKTMSSSISSGPVNDSGEEILDVADDVEEVESEEDAEDIAEQDEQYESEQDESEAELEKLVFGDRSGFRSAIQDFDQSDEARSEEDQEAAKDQDFAAVQDSDLFFLDTTAGDAPSLLPLDKTKDGKEVALGGRGPAAWVDSDDDRMTVSLMSVPRLRKLRTFEGEDVISGREYTNRLRRQYETLHPRPKWADWRASKDTSRKRRRIESGTRDDSSDASESDIDMDVSDDDDDEVSAKPLSSLLRSTASLTTNIISTSKRLKLAPENLPITRMRDLEPAQPHSIDALSIHPTLPLILSAGNSSTMYLHHLLPDPVAPDPPNPLLTSLNLKNTPLTTAAFSPFTNTDATHPDHPKIYLSARRRYFHTWSLPTGAITKTTRINNEQRTTQRSFETLKPSPCGRYLALQGSTRKGGGVINILNASSTQWIAQARIDAVKGIASFAWWSDGRGLGILSKDGEISEWNVDARRTVWRWSVEGGYGATVVEMGGRIPDEILFAGLGKKNKGKKSADKKRDAAAPIGPDRWIAVGSQSGIVSVYDRVKFLEEARKSWTEVLHDSENPPDVNGNVKTTQQKDGASDGNPSKRRAYASSTQPALRALENLTTPISNISFSPDGQLMCISSRWKRDALRLVHLPSCTVYQNWPTGKTPLGRVSATALGEWVDQRAGGQNGEKRIVLMVGNESGHLRGWIIGGV